MPATGIRRLGPGDFALVEGLNRLFGEAFDEPETYCSRPRTRESLAALLEKPHVVALVAERQGAVIGALVAYVLEKLEQPRSELYIYDLAVQAEFRRQGVASALIEEAQRIAGEQGAWVVYVQADHVDPPAIALYSKLGRREDVLHFDLPVLLPASPAGRQ